MTPREVVRRAVEFRNPPRLPINGFGDVSDVVWLPADDVKPKEAEGDADTDQWMCRWAHTDTPNMGQVKGHPLEDLSHLHDMPWPDAEDAARYANVPQRLDEIETSPESRGKYRVTGIFMLLWERLHSLRGFEAAMVDIMDDRPEIHELAERIVDYDIAFIRHMHSICGDSIDGFSFTEDWGTETDLMVSPATFRRFFAPRYRRIFRAARSCGWHVWMHSCGKINKAIPILLECGVNVLNMQQPVTNGIDEIGAHYRGHVAFETLCDIQKTLPSGDRDAITSEAEHLMRTWGTPAGGFILGDYGDHRAIGADPEIKQFMLDEFRRLDPWKQSEPGA